jgi:hypothetical protein
VPQAGVLALLDVSYHLTVLTDRKMGIGGSLQSPYSDGVVVDLAGLASGRFLVDSPPV